MIKTEDILDRMLTHAYDESSYYDVENDKILDFERGENKNPYSPYEKEESLPSTMIRLPLNVNEYQIMQAFLSHVENEEKKERLNEILQGRDASMNFKKALHEMDLWQRYLCFRLNAYGAMIEDWYEENGLLPTEE